MLWLWVVGKYIFPTAADIGCSSAIHFRIVPITTPHGIGLTTRLSGVDAAAISCCVAFVMGVIITIAAQ
jgi:hypothetical protein